jgi:hypothetical protein
LANWGLGSEVNSSLICKFGGVHGGEPPVNREYPPVELLRGKSEKCTRRAGVVNNVRNADEHPPGENQTLRMWEKCASISGEFEFNVLPSNSRAQVARHALGRFGC